jgi:hypothetical protein
MWKSEAQLRGLNVFGSEPLIFKKAASFEDENY